LIIFTLASMTATLAVADSISPTCISSDADQLCIGVKNVSLIDSSQPTPTVDEVILDIAQMNQVWKQCKIAFQLESYQAVTATSLGLSFELDHQNPYDTSITDQYLKPFIDKNSLLWMNVGTIKIATSWYYGTGLTAGLGVSETLGHGDPFYITLRGIFTSETTPHTAGLAFALGVFQGLSSVYDVTNVMSNLDVSTAYPGKSQNLLTSDQCQEARELDLQYAPEILRK
jgi:hypothetical protein